MIKYTFNNIISSVVQCEISFISEVLLVGMNQTMNKPYVSNESDRKVFKCENVGRNMCDVPYHRRLLVRVSSESFLEVSRSDRERKVDGGKVQNT